MQVWNFIHAIYNISLSCLCVQWIAESIHGVTSFLPKAQPQRTLQALVAVVAPPGISLAPAEKKVRTTSGRSPRQGSGSGKAGRAANASGRSRNASAKGEGRAENEAKLRLCASAVDAVSACMPPLPQGWSILVTQPVAWPEEDGAPWCVALNLQCKEALPLQVSVGMSSTLFIWRLPSRQLRATTSRQRHYLFPSRAALAT